MKMVKYWLLRFYPRAWRERYEEEFLALLEQYAPTFRDLLDILLNALNEQTSTLLKERRDMLNQRRTQPSAFIFRACLVIGSIIVLGMTISGMILTRAELAHDSTTLSSALTSCIILVLYGAAGWQAARFTRQTGLLYGGICGLAAGAVFLLYNSINNLGNPDGTTYEILANGTMATEFLLCLLAGLLATRATGHFVTGLLAGMWTGMISILIGGISLWLITALFNNIAIHGTLFLQDYLKSGVKSVTDFAILDGLDGFSIMLTIFPIGGAILGAIGGAIGNGFVRRQVQS